MSEDGTRDRSSRIGLNRQINRRMFLAFAASATVGLLAACGTDDDDDVVDDGEEVAADPVEDDDTDDDEELVEDDEDRDDSDVGIELQEFDDPEPGPPAGDKPDELVMAWGTSQFHNHGVDPQRH